MKYSAPWRIFYPSPPEETHLSPSNGMKVSLEWHESLRQGRAYSVTLLPAFSRRQGYRIMPCPFRDFLVTPRRPNQSPLEGRSSLKRRQIQSCYSGTPCNRDVGSSGTGGCCMCPPVCGSSLNLISTREAHYDHPITTCLPGFSDLATSLYTKKVCAYYWFSMNRRLPLLLIIKPCTFLLYLWPNIYALHFLKTIE